MFSERLRTLLYLENYTTVSLQEVNMVFGPDENNGYYQGIEVVFMKNN